MNATVKKQVIKEMKVVQTVVQKPYVFVQIQYINELGKLYWGNGFAKWNTEDMSEFQFVEKEMVKSIKCGCDWCLSYANMCWKTIQQLEWNEDRGITIATGRAVKQVVEQIEVEQKQIDWEAMKELSEIPLVEKSKAGQDDQYPANSGGLDKLIQIGDEFLKEQKYARSKVNPGKMINNEK